VVAGGAVVDELATVVVLVVVLVVGDVMPLCAVEHAAATTNTATSGGARRKPRDGLIACLDRWAAREVPAYCRTGPNGPAAAPGGHDSTFPGVSNAVSVAMAGLVLTGLVTACGGANAPAGAPPRPVPRLTTTASTPPAVPTTVVTPTTVLSPTADGFAPVTAGSNLTQAVKAEGTVLRIDPRLLRIALMPGTTEPGGTFPEGGEVPVADRGALAAVTNAGFKRVDARGGEAVDGRTVGTLVAGAASLVIRADGTFDLGAWQQEVTPEAGDVAVLQNLVPLIDHGQPAPDLGTDILQRWGLTFRPLVPVSVWRSGLGIDAQGRLLYAAGPNLVPAQLAVLLLSAGAVRAMQLDINHLWVFAAAFTHPDPTHPEAVQGQALLPGMTPTPTHVLTPGTRDFLAIYQKAAGHPPAGRPLGGLSPGQGVT
jgi:hypothetical protein